MGNRGEVWLAVSGECHEEDILTAQLFDLATARDATRIGQQYDLQQDFRVVRRTAVFIIIETVIKDAQVKFVLYQVGKTIFKGTRKYLAIEVDRDHLYLIVVVFFEACHQEPLIDRINFA